MEGQKLLASKAHCDCWAPQLGCPKDQMPSDPRARTPEPRVTKRKLCCAHHPERSILLPLVSVGKAEHAGQQWARTSAMLRCFDPSATNRPLLEA